MFPARFLPEKDDFLALYTHSRCFTCILGNGSNSAKQRNTWLRRHFPLWSPPWEAAERSDPIRSTENKCWKRQEMRALSWINTQFSLKLLTFSGNKFPGGLEQCHHWNDAENKTMSTWGKVQGCLLTSSYNLCVCVCVRVGRGAILMSWV